MASLTRAGGSSAADLVERSVSAAGHREDVERRSTGTDEDEAARRLVSDPAGARLSVARSVVLTSGVRLLAPDSFLPPNRRERASLSRDPNGDLASSGETSGRRWSQLISGRRARFWLDR